MFDHRHAAAAMDGSLDHEEVGDCSFGTTPPGAPPTSSDGHGGMAYFRVGLPHSIIDGTKPRSDSCGDETSGKQLSFSRTG